MTTKINLIENGTGINGSATSDLTAFYDMSGGNAVFYVKYSDVSFSLHSIAKSITGTIDAQILLYGGNTNVFADAVLIKSATMSADPDATIFEKDSWNHDYVFIELKVNNVTGGELYNIITIKN